MGELGIVAMVQGPGPHLKIPPNGLCGGVVKPEEFTYFHEMVVQEDIPHNIISYIILYTSYIIPDI